MGAVGEVRVAKLDKYPVFSHSVAELRGRIIEIFRAKKDGGGGK